MIPPLPDTQPGAASSAEAVPLHWRVILSRRLPGLVGALCFLGYLGWNLYWLLQRAIPPSIFRAATGLPCPTTGGTRSMRFLLQGDWQTSLRANPMTVPILLLVLVSLLLPFHQLWSRGRFRLPGIFLWVWGGTLLLAWVLKLLGDPLYW